MFPPRAFARVSFLGLAAIACLSVQPAAACNFLENLFGGCRPAQVYPPADAAAPAVKKARLRPHVARNPDDYKQKTLAAPEGQKEGSIAHFAADGTLRKGDIVVTPNGPLVYAGKGGGQTPAFAPLRGKQAGASEVQRAGTAPGVAVWAPGALAVSPNAEPVRQVQRGVEGGAL